MILEKHQQLMDRLVQNHCDYYNTLLEKSREELIDSASEIAGTMDVFDHLVGRQYTEHELDYLLQFQNPLEVVADHWTSQVFDLAALEAVVIDVLDKEDDLTSYPLEPRAAEPKQEEKQAQKPFIRAQLAAKPVPGDKPVQKSREEAR